LQAALVSNITIVVIMKNPVLPGASDTDPSTLSESLKQAKAAEERLKRP
jgi:hypothetical protein